MPAVRRRAANGAGTIVQRSDGRYQGAVRVLTADGGKKRVAVYGHSRTEVRRKLQLLAVQSEKGIPHVGSSWTVRAWLENWLDGVVSTKNRARTLESYRGIANRYLIPLLGSQRLDHLSVLHVQAAVDLLHEQGVGARTIQQVRTVLSAALSRAERSELVHRNVARLVELPKYEAKEIRPWTLEEAQRFLAATRGHQWEIGYTLLLIYGMRRGEAVALRWSDIDFNEGTIRVRQQLQRINGKVIACDVKTSAGRRTLPLIPAVRTLLEARANELGIDPETVEPGALVLTSKTGAPIEPGNFARTFYLMSERAGLRRITVHQTRHTAATLLKSMGVQARDVQLILGHSNVSTTQQLYQHGYVEEHRDMLSGVAAALSGDPEQAASLYAPAAQSGIGCQVQPMRGSEVTIAVARQDIESNENRRLPGVETADFLGGSGGTRTHDILLKSSILAGLSGLATPVVRELQARTQQHFFGAMVVRLVVNFDDQRASANQAEGLRIARDGLREAVGERLRLHSFPYSLLPVSPFARKDCA
jgi:integrase